MATAKSPRWYWWRVWSHTWAVAGVIVFLIGLDPLTTARGQEVADSAWISKAAQALRYQGRIRSSQEMARYAGKTQDEILDDLFADPRFAMTVLDFNLYYLGLKQDNLLTGVGNYLTPGQNSFGLNTMVGENPPALHSALSVATGGNYFDLFSDWHPDYWSMRSPPSRNPKDYERLKAAGWQFKIDSRYSDQALTDDIINFIKNALNQEISSIATNPRKPEEICNYSVNFQIGKALEALGIGRPDLEVFARRMDAFSVDCRWPPEDFPIDLLHRDKTKHTDKSALQADFIAYRAYLFPLIDLVRSWPVLAPGSESSPLDRIWRSPTPPMAAMRNQPFGFFHKYFLDRYRNSSTNFNRKRAAKVLNTFFCDNLVPIQLPSSTPHGDSSLHASDPACQACHCEQSRYFLGSRAG